MCGIIGYVGTERDPVQVLVNGLEKLEYRGYDSTGIAVVNSSISVRKREGNLSALESSLPVATFEGSVGIGHTRWSTHGSPSDRNAHPHTDCHDTVAVVHNGIIENYRALRAELEAKGHAFESETDTEVLPHLIEEARTTADENEQAFRDAVDRIEGTYAIAAVFSGDETIYATRRRSPLVVGIGENGYFLASDVPAFLEYTDRVLTLTDDAFATIDRSNAVVTNEDGIAVESPIETIEWKPADAEKSGYTHYMLKEIHEQPLAIRNCLSGRIDTESDRVNVDALEDLVRPERIHLVACGTSYHAALYGGQLLRERGIQTQEFLASEYDVETIPIDDETLVIGVTQSGETADTLQALRGASRAGASTLAVTNVVSSSVTRETDHVLYIRAGPEIGVAATKTFASQQVALALLACELATEPTDQFVAALQRLPDLIQSTLGSSRARDVADAYLDSDAFFFIGRGYNAPVALEGALKLKEISYEHAEGFAAGELKHGPLALVTERTPVFTLLAGDRSAKIRGNVEEVQARGAPTIAITDATHPTELGVDSVLTIPPLNSILAPILANVQLQLVSYWIASGLGRPIDTPRNLAKSVTVE